MNRSKITCFGLLLVCFTMLGSLFVASSDVNALKHEFEGLQLLQPAVPHYSSDTNNYIDWSSETDFFSFYGISGFRLRFDGSAWDSSLSDLRVRKEIRYLDLWYDSNSGECYLHSPRTYGFSSVYMNSSFSVGIGSLSSSSPSIFTRSGATGSIGQLPEYTYVPDYYQGNKLCRSRSGLTNIASYSLNQTFSNYLPSYPNPNDTMIYNVSTVLNNDNVLPYWYYTDTLPFSSSFSQSDGIVYSKKFSFNTIFNRPITSFSSLALSLDEYSGFWYDDTNLYAGRDIDFHFLFRFESPFSLESTFLDDGSISVNVSAVKKVYSSSNNEVSLSIPCTSTVRQVGEDDYYWDISCPYTLTEDYIIFVPYLEIDGAGNRVLTTTGDWSFSSVYIVTDNDSTLGYSFNDSPTGNTDIWKAYWSSSDNPFDNSDPDWFTSLKNLFHFNFTNPFYPLFNLFTDQNSCASIPTIAGMLHSNESTICPWFSSSVRNIATPILGLASAMLVFGFAVRWLGSSSGNLFEDSANESLTSVNHSGFRRFKK